MVTSEARKKYQKEYQAKNRDRLLAAQRKRNRTHYLQNKGAYKARNQAWREKNPERYKALTKSYQLANRDKVKRTSAEWYAANKDRAARTGRLNKLKAYGLTLEKFERMLVAQLGLCLVCMKEMKNPVIDHNHETGAVRGLLHRKCNAALGLLLDSPEVLRRAADYLTR